MSEFRMPSLGADMEAATLAEWLKKPGDTVARGDVVAVVETQKGAIEIEAFEDGVLERCLVEPGVEVPVGAPLAIIRTPGEPPGAATAPAAPSPAPAPPLPPQAQPQPQSQSQPQATATTPPPAPGRVQASPAARRLASERGIQLDEIAGSGPGGVVVRLDVETALAARAAAPSAPKPAAGFDFSQMRAAIAAVMSRSKREIPHYYLSNTIDLSAATDWVSRTNAERPPERRLLIGTLFVKATARAVKDFPEFNGAFEAGVFRPSAAVHVGVAISIRGGGLAAPAIHDTADLTLDELMAQMRDLIARVRAGRFRSSEIADPTITVSSLGERGVEALYGVIYPPQVAIVGFGKVVRRPWVVGEAIAARPVVTSTLAADHRVSDGHRGGLFLAKIADLLQDPEAL
jgi:pyruvate dehydrogenase E2 component (dihydrolipoamide acetyltransferase)